MSKLSICEIYLAYENFQDFSAWSVKQENNSQWRGDFHKLNNFASSQSLQK